jgi:hypothetical protein
MDITFGVQSRSGCASDGIVDASIIKSVVDGAKGNHWKLYK